MLKRRLAKLETIEGLLADLTHDLGQVVGACPACGAYRVDDAEEQNDYQTLREMRLAINRMRTAMWAQEES